MNANLRSAIVIQVESVVFLSVVVNINAAFRANSTLFSEHKSYTVTSLFTGRSYR